MTTVVIRIPKDIKEFIDGLVKQGAFADAEDFILNLLRNLKAESEFELSDEEHTRLATLRAEIGIGLTQADRQEFVGFDARDVIEENRARRRGATLR